MDLIPNLTTFIKRLKLRRYTTLRVEFPISLPRDCTPGEYEYLSSAEIESKVLAVHTTLTDKCGITPKQLLGTIVPDINAYTTPRDKIIVTCRVPDDAPMLLIRDTFTQTFGGNCAIFV